MKKNLTNLIIVSFLIYVIIGDIYSTIKSRRYDIDFKHPKVDRIKSIPYDEYATYEYNFGNLETMLNDERYYAELIWDSFENGQRPYNNEYIEEGGEIDWNEYIEIEEGGEIDWKKVYNSINLLDSGPEDEKIYLPLEKHQLNTIQKIFLIEDYLIEYPEGLRQLDKYLDYFEIREIEDKINKSILSDIKRPNILEIWLKKGEGVDFPPLYEFDDTLDVENYQRVNKLFDSLFRIYEMKNNYHKRYTPTEAQIQPIQQTQTEFEKGWAE